MKSNPASAMAEARLRYERAMRRGCVAMADDALSEIEELRAAMPPLESAEFVVFSKPATLGKSIIETSIKRGIVFIRRGRRLERQA